MNIKQKRSWIINWRASLLGGLFLLGTVANLLAGPNTPPTFNANTGLTLNEGALGTITAAQLDFKDAQQADTAITFTVTALPVNGQILFNGSALAVNGTFTQANLNSGVIKYAHDGTDTTSDSFTFTVSDGAGGVVPGQTFSFTITPVNDATALAAIPTITFSSAPGGAFALDGMGGSTDINGIALEVYFADASRARINSALTFQDPYAVGTVDSGLAVNYTNNAGSYYVIIKSRNAGDNFWLQSLQLCDYGGNNVKIEAFDNGVSQGSVNVTVSADPWYFTFDKNGALTPSIFQNADEIRINGQNAGVIWLTINNLKIAAPVTPNTSPVFVGVTTTLTVGQNSGANDLKSLLHVSDPDSSQTETWSQSVAPAHGSLSFVSATAASGSTNITPGGTITYTPTVGYVGTDSFSVQVSDGNGGSAVRSLGVTVNPPPGITSLTATNGSYGSAFSYTITASNNPTSFGASGLPAGLSLDPLTGIISGTLRQSGSFPITLSATNATSYGTAVLTLSVAKVNLMVSGVVANNKVYDGTTNATLNLAGASLNGVVNGDSLSLNAAGVVAGFASSNVGNGKAVTISGLALSGVAATNYTLTQPSGTANITPALAVVTLNRSVQLYSGSAKSVTAATSPAGLPVSLTYNGSATVPASIGTYTVIGTVTDPNYSGSATNFLYVAVAPQFLSVQRTNGNSHIVFVWSAMPAVNYQVQYTSSLLPVSWTSFNGPVSATNTTMTTMDSINTGLLMRLYRVQLLLE
ncbi:MAG: cadherin-like domain-containing protein [Verrucomicrobiae bacterium]|nr:cadherin-like domain-containing protein [Verrucomicrobiae bacterium]